MRWAKLHVRAAALLAVAGLAAAACQSGSTDPGDAIIDLAFLPSTIDLGPDASATILLENRGSRPEGPILLSPGAVTRDGSTVFGVHLDVVPAEVPTLNPGDDVTLTLLLVFDGTLAPGDYETSLTAQLHGEAVSSVALQYSAAAPPPTGETETLSISAGPASPRQGDVVVYQAEVRDSTGSLITDPTLTWSVAPSTAGLMLVDGRFVGYEPGAAEIVAQASGLADTLPVNITPRGLTGSFQTVGTGAVTSHYTSDVWVHGDHAYTGTWSCRGQACGNRLHVWNVATPASPMLTDIVIVDARVVNDVKVRADGAVGVITHEISNDGLNGVSILDLSDPAHPHVVARFTSGLESGVHNVWIEGDYVYIVVDNVGNGLRIMNISNPAAPTIVASFYAGSSFLHDVYVRDGLAFLSHWNAGLVILDVGNGIAGGSPANPIEVSRIRTTGDQVHNAWYWPDAGYVFVGEEDFGTPGIMHVVDVSDLTVPTEVATFSVSGATPHNFWLDEERGMLYAAWYENGVRAIDVSGTLLGQLERQGREIASSQYGVGAACVTTDATCTWAPQLHDGLIFASDMNSGLWVLDPSF